MASAPGPATVVTAFDGEGRPSGLTVSAVSSVSLDPPLALACFDRASNTLQAVRESGAFTINYLAHGHEGVALNFATKASEKFADLTWQEPEGGVGGPILTAHVAAHAVCEVENEVPGGDHVVVVGRVLEGEADERSHALVYARRRFFTGLTVEADGEVR